MKYFLRLVLACTVISCVPLGEQAKEIKYNHNSITISEIKGKVDFKVQEQDRSFFIELMESITGTEVMLF
ncbi:hypothetical protein ACFYKX_04190 [Cytobacillus sp. FJAT-54145]|uniref:Uncharacterized protein n=1 Tax=Cytobacillus spartinae TaxID=3299023 RepID=A0ABW6KAJ9_9BACI